MLTNKRIAYIHGRFGPHIMHGRLAKSVNAEFHMVDRYKMWNDGKRSKLYLIYAWIYNALAFKKPKNFDIFLVSGPHFSPIIMKFLRLKKSQKVVVHLGDETMYFLSIDFYSKLMRRVLIWLLNQYDALLCEGQMAADLAKINGISRPKIYTTYLGVPKERQNELLKLQPKLSSNHLIFVSSGPKGWRTFYKGLDLMLRAYSKAFEINDTLQFTIVGEWDKQLQEELTSMFSTQCKASISFVGQTNNIQDYLQDSCFYFHVSRGDAFPTAVLEAMSAGLIPLISEWTGSKEVVAKADPDFILPLDEDSIVKKLISVTQLSMEERETLSYKMREASRSFTEQFALDHYQETFRRMEKEFKD